jgi:hypothetical protein
VNEISVAELIELLQNESASIDTQFQLWITITSAVVIASFAARHYLSFWMKTFVAVIYLLASSIIALRYANDASQFVLLHNELSDRGVDYPTVIDLRSLRALVYLGGTFATLAIIYLKPNPKIDDTQFDESPEQPGSG